MSTKERFYYSESARVCAYQELSFDNENENPVCIQIDNPDKFQIDKQARFEQVTLQVASPEIFYELAIAWCKKRNLQGRLGGPSGKE